ncbi:LysR family transcriptional regulator [Akkermansiaceae bacterium]|nr:LysR family transcriptional regulator [Akkermansiaceae bacterium]
MSNSVFERKGVSIERLKTLVALGDSEGITAAAGGQAVRQSQFSRQLKELEVAMELSLVDRSVVPHGLTKEGKSLAAAARSLLEGVEREVRELRMERQTLRIGAGESVIQWLLIPLLSKLMDEGEVRIEFRNLRSREAIDAVRTGKVDLALSHNFAKNVKTVHSKLIGSYAPVLVCRKTILKGRNSVSIDQLSDFNLAVISGSGALRTKIDDLLLSSGPRIVMEATSYGQAVESCRVGKKTLAIVPGFVGRGWLSKMGLKVVSLKEFENEERELRLFWSGDAALERREVQGGMLLLTGMDRI